MIRRGFVASLFIVGALASCSPAAAPSPAPSLASASTPSGPRDACPSATRLRTTIEGFLDDYNAGRVGLADRYFAPEPAFQWYSERPARLGQDAYTRSSLEDYLLRRHAEGDRLSLASVQVNAVRDGVGNFGFHLQRGGADVESKGAFDCTTGKFIVWSIGPAPGPS